MAVESDTLGAVCEEDEEVTGAGIDEEGGTEEGTAKGGGTTRMGIGEDKKEGRREDVRSGGVETAADSGEEVWTDSSTACVDEENQLDRDEEKGI